MPSGPACPARRAKKKPKQDFAGNGVHLFEARGPEGKVDVGTPRVVEPAPPAR